MLRVRLHQALLKSLFKVWSISYNIITDCWLILGLYMYNKYKYNNNENRCVKYICHIDYR